MTVVCPPKIDTEYLPTFAGTAFPGQFHLTTEDALRGLIHVGKQRLELTRQEMSIFYLLNKNPGGNTATEIRAFAFPKGPCTTKNFGVHMFNMRAKLKSAGLAVVYEPKTCRYVLRKG